MTVQKCIDGCAAAGFSSAGVEYGSECYCGNVTFPPGSSAEPQDCSMPCRGDASQYCGGSYRILIYARAGADTTPSRPTSSWTPAQGGCWSDNMEGVRALEHGANGYDDLTPAKCQAICEAQGFNLAGVEYGRECFCGNTIMGSNRPTTGGCNMRCTGDSAQICGGANAINIYVKDNYQYTTGPATVLDSYGGYSKTQCWEDSAGNRVLKNQPAFPISGDNMTVQKCIDGCKTAGFSSAGVEYGRECYCDNVSYPLSQSHDMRECNKPCTGDGSQFCGGPNRILIYYQPPITTYRGILQVVDAGNGAVLGYISKHLANGGVQYALGNEADAVHVTFQGTLAATSFRGVELTAEVCSINAGLRDYMLTLSVAGL
ncbi:WSC-domain-containing protein [Serendipita vermifera]|nr:WSC-domain-containing protein [Serendipita vermifera]